ncbi:MAG: phosphate ABC transporter substrate-binding protein PstS [Caldilineaceae bacterium]
MQIAIVKKAILAPCLILALVLSACAQMNAGPTATPIAMTEAAATATPAASAVTATEGMTATAGMTITQEMTATASTGGNATLPASCNLRDLNVTLNATGASFPNPIYQRWIEEYKTVNPNVTINYQSTGSGQGKSDFLGGVTDFGGSDALFTDEEHQQAPDTLFIPTVMGAVVTTYNLEGVEGLRFSPDTIAGIFLGQITNWTDPAIAQDNPNVQFPDQDITVVHRSDGSGTTFIFTNYLSKVSSEWADKVGSGTAVEWPTGIGGEKNDGVAAAVQQTPGAFGYVELIYALANNLPAPAVKNAAGNYVDPSLETVTNAAAGFLNDMPADLQFMVTNPPTGENAYPISGFTWLMVHPSYDNADKAMALADFICWAYTEGDQYAQDLHYAPLPTVVKEQAYSNLSTVQANGQPVFGTGQ